MLKYKVNFYINNSKNDSDSPIRALVSFNSIRPPLYTGIFVKPSQWDKETQRLIDRKDIRNKEIDKIERLIEDIFNEFDVIEKRFPTEEEFKISYLSKIGKSKKNEIKSEKKYTIINAIEDFSNEIGDRDSWTQANFNRFNKLKNHFSYFNKNILLKNITESDLTKFIKYFQNSPIDLKSGKESTPHKNTTVARTIKDVRTVLKWAHKKGFYEGSLHETFYPKFKGANYDLNEPIYLSWERLLKFYNHEFLPEQKHLEETRDIIAFCAFSSLRYSDAFALKKSQLREDFFYVVTQKTTDPLKIDLNDYTIEIIEKYKDRPGPKVLPTKSMKEANEQIKVIGKILGFDEPVNYTYFVGDKRFDETTPFYETMSTHIGRKSFIVNSLFLKIPAEVIMKWTGHKDYQTMKPYIAISKGLKKSEMNKFNKK